MGDAKKDFEKTKEEEIVIYTLSVFFVSLLCATLGQAAQPLGLIFPTDNRALLDGQPEDFYMYTARKYWTGGQYGFVRNLKQTKNDGTIATRFHEGVDIKPMRRDRAGNPLDEVRAIANGTVVHVNKSSGASNYGKYVVVQHDWGYGRFFSLYAHLSQIMVTIDQPVNAGTPLGIMGFTGRGINRERAHVHLELNMMISSHFDDWHQKMYGSPSPHGPYNGLNLIGVDVASLILSQEKRPNLTIPQFLASAQPYYKVAVPRGPDPLDVVRFYPWLAKGNHEKPSHSWEIAFTASGIPLSVAPSFRKVNIPTVTYVRTSRSSHSYFTRKRLKGSGRKASLTNSGRTFLALFTGEYRKKPVPTAPNTSHP